jgi:hypothetical protein
MVWSTIEVEVKVTLVISSEVEEGELMEGFSLAG